MKPRHSVHQRTPAPANAVAIAQADAPSPGSPLGGLVFSLSIFASAFLLFLVQPLIARYILPWFGGTVGVWSVCMLFFQALLLGGYIYAHLSIRLLPPRAQAIVHIALLLAAIAMLPTIPADRWKPQDSGNPTWPILILLTATLGLPYFALSATAPLLQAWFSRLNPAHSPYRLYALSNAASLLALLSYPFIIEPALSRTAQARFWSLGFLCFAAVFSACAFLQFRRFPLPSLLARPSDSSSDARPPISHFLLWILLPACASALLLGTTNKICQDVAVVPFLWVLPLALYLLSFILPFENLRWYSRLLWLAILLAIQLAMLYAVFEDIRSIKFRITAFSIVMLAGCMICHGELARLKPRPSHLTAYYLCIAIGGMLGGLSVALLAPLLFDGYYESYVAALLCCTILLGVMMLDAQLQLHKGTGRLALYTLIPVCILLVLLLYTESVNTAPNATIIARQRNFYGATIIFDQDASINPAKHRRTLRHGGIDHGVQALSPTDKRRPSSYYDISSGIARVLRVVQPDQPRRLGVIGLGVGTIAAYGRPGDYIKFYELDPDIRRLAQTYFTYLADSPATIDFAFGDGRLSLEREQPQQFDILIVDAFSSDAIPVHLLTRESIQIYLRHLKPDGALVIHISNKYLNLEPVIARLAEDAGLHAALLKPLGEIRRDEDYPRPGDLPSHWALLTRNQSLLESPDIKSHGGPCQRIDGLRLWTDDYASLLPIVR